MPKISCGRAEEHAGLGGLSQDKAVEALDRHEDSGRQEELSLSHSHQILAL